MGAYDNNVNNILKWKWQKTWWEKNSMKDNKIKHKRWKKNKVQYYVKQMIRLKWYNKTKTTWKMQQNKNYVKNNHPPKVTNM